MKYTSFLFSLVILLTVGLVSCSNPLEEIENAPELATKVIVATHHAYAQVPGSQNQVFAAEIRHFDDGTVDVLRSTVSRTPSMELTNVFSDAASVQISISGESFSSAQAGWYIPFDPSAQAIAVGGGVTVELRCFCDANGQCLIYGDQMPDGKYKLGCASKNCMGNCDGIVIINDNNKRLVVGNGIFVAASNVQVF
jgi:hypothetical protein